MRKTTSSDGTDIAYDQSGKGPALILVGGALSTRGAAAALSPLLAPFVTVFAYDRRGRGDSGDTAPYAVGREVEDIDALIQVAGGSAFLYGHSSGAVLALEAANKLSARVKKLALYEPPFIVDDSRPPLTDAYAARLRELVASGRRGDALEYFMTTAVGMPAAVVAQMRNAPMWPGMEKIAHTLLYDDQIMGDTMTGHPLPSARWTSAIMPTLVTDGGASPASLRHAAKALADILPTATYRSLDGQTHAVDPAVLAPVLIEFLRGSQ